MEDRLLNIALKYPNFIPRLKPLISDNIYKQFNKIHKFWEKSGKVPSEKVLIQMAPELVNFRSETVIDEGDLLWLIEEHNRVQKIAGVYSGIEEKLESDELELNDIISLWDENIIELEPPNIRITESAADIIKELAQMQQQIDERVDTGYDQLNKLLTKHGKAGWAKKYCYLFQGLTGTGKTFFLANLARKAMEMKKNVVFVSVEMDQWQIRDLLYRSYFSVNSHQGIQDALVLKKEVPFKLAVINYSNMSHNMFDLQRDIKHLKFKPDIVIIDYLDNFAPSRNVKQSWEVQQVVSTDMSRMAQELNVPVITATQTNRTAASDKMGGTKRNMGYEAVGSSFNKTQVFAGIWSIITDDNDMDEATNTRKFELICNKNREGKQSKTYFYLNYSNAHLYEPSELGGDNTDAFAKAVALASKSIGIGSNNEDEETRKETEKNFDKYFKNLRDDPNYKKAIDDIKTNILTLDQKRKLIKQIGDYLVKSQRRPTL